MSETKYVHLTDDEPIPGQMWALLSIVTPELVKNCTIRGLKIRGVYGSEEQAKQAASELQKKDSVHNIYVAPVGKWLPWEDDPSKAMTEEYANKELDRIMKGLRENQAKAQLLHEQRKQDLVTKSIQEGKKRKKANKKGKKWDKKNTTNKVEYETVDASQFLKVEDKLKSNTLEEDMEKVKDTLQQEDKNLKEDLKILENKKQNVSELDKELEEAQKLYEQLTKE